MAPRWRGDSVLTDTGLVSLFSGCGCLDLGLERAGWEVLSQCEYDRHAQAVLRHRWPGVPLYGDVRALRGADLPGAGLWSFGSPCKGFSVCNSTNQHGLDHEESNLAYQVTRLLAERAERERPPLLLWENVANVYSGKHAEGVALWLASLRELGYTDGRVMFLTGFDAGVPQVRKRALTLLSRVGTVPEPTLSWESDVPLLSSLLEEEPDEAWQTSEQRQRLYARCRSRWLKKVAERGEAEARRVVEQYRRLLIEGPESVSTFTRVWSRNPSGERSHALVTGRDAFVGIPAQGIRRLTNTERERLMGLPDGWTAIGLYEDGKEKKVCKTARARMTGNGVIVGVAEMVGRVAAETLRALTNGKLPAL